jgi:SAM-dependent methyltransferase
LLFHSIGAQSIGIDYDHIEPDPTWHSLLTIVKQNGIERAAKTLLRHTLFDRAYYRCLGELLGRPLRFSGIRLQMMDATALQFPDQRFHYACSSDVFEHIADVEGATRELARILRPGGIAYIGINVFPGISGGHHLEWAEPDTRPSRRVPPWDHLRQNLFPSSSYLNRLRESDYLRIFRSHFAIIDLQTVYQGETQLTDDIARELSIYSRHELLQGALTVILRKSEKTAAATF